MVTTTMTGWNILPDIIGDGVSDQKDIMTAICETKGATYDGVDCVGELNDASVHVSWTLHAWEDDDACCDATERGRTQHLLFFLGLIYLSLE